LNLLVVDWPSPAGLPNKLLPVLVPNPVFEVLVDPNPPNPEVVAAFPNPDVLFPKLLVPNTLFDGCDVAGWPKVEVAVDVAGAAPATFLFII
jgi:hypothetical protein